MGTTTTRRSGCRVRAGHFLRAQEGAALVEFVIILPLLLWAWLALYYFWDVYAAMNRVQKAAFTVSDALTRSSGEVSPAYLEGLNAYLDYLAGDAATPKTRVSSIGWNDTDKRYFVMWSHSPKGAVTPLTTATITDIQHHLPVMTGLQTVLVVETEVDHAPPLTIDEIGPLHIGMTNWTFREVVVSPPRFVVKVCFTGKSCNVTS